MPKHHSTSLGVGDDAAVLEYPAETDILVTTDMLLENVHFDLTYVPLKHLGYKAAVVNFSDIYAMNGVPRQITVSLGVSKRFTVEHMEELYHNIASRLWFELALDDILFACEIRFKIFTSGRCNFLPFKELQSHAHLQTERGRVSCL